MDYIVKRAAERVHAFRQMQTADWWGELSPEGQAEYLKEHPDSKKAKEIHEKRKQEQLKRPSIKSHEDALEKEEHPDMVKHADDHPDNIAHLHPDAQKFFKDGHDKPGSPERKAAAGFLAKKTKQIIKAVKKAAHHNATEWKHGGKGIAKLFAGKKLNDHEKEGVKAIIKDVLVTAGVVAIGGGLAHGVLAAMAHMGRDILSETFFKTVAHGIVEHGAEIASVNSSVAVAFTALIHEVLAEAEAEEAAKDDKKKGKFPPKKEKKDGDKAKKSKKAPPSKKAGDDDGDEDAEDDSDEDEDSSSDEPEIDDGEDSDDSDADGSSDGEDEEGDDAPDLDEETSQAVEQVIKFLTKFAEEGKIPKEAWLAAASEEPMEDGKVFPDQEPAEEDEDSEEDASEGDEDSDEDVNDDEDEEDSGDGSTVEDKVKQKDPDEPPKNSKLKKKSKDEESDEDEDDDDEDDEFNSSDEGNDSE